MTESEWLTCSDPKSMLEFLRGKVSDRKLRLFAVACCRRIWDWLLDGRSREAVEVSELFAESLAGEAELEVALDNARAAAMALCQHPSSAAVWTVHRRFNWSTASGL